MSDARQKRLSHRQVVETPCGQRHISSSIASTNAPLGVERKLGGFAARSLSAHSAAAGHGTASVPITDCSQLAMA
jgi:hypothetical protein